MRPVLSVLGPWKPFCCLFVCLFVGMFKDAIVPVCDSWLPPTTTPFSLLSTPALFAMLQSAKFLSESRETHALCFPLMKIFNTMPVYIWPLFHLMLNGGKEKNKKVVFNMRASVDAFTWIFTLDGIYAGTQGQIWARMNALLSRTHRNADASLWLLYKQSCLRVSCHNS